MQWESHTICGFFCPASCTQYVFRVHPCCGLCRFIPFDGHIAFYRTKRPPFIRVSLHRWTSGVFPPPGHWAHAAGATGERAPETCSQFLGVRAYPGAALQDQVEFVSDFLRTVPRFRSHSPGLSDSFPPGDGCPHFLSPCPILVLEYSDCTSKATR